MGSCLKALVLDFEQLAMFGVLMAFMGVYRLVEVVPVNSVVTNKCPKVQGGRGSLHVVTCKPSYIPYWNPTARL